ncbi:MAG: hypothetical protein O7G85_12490 [Planctomycetota bacterium]|nr:hypothetical protein [Planctomycetota bacterium]
MNWETRPAIRADVIVEFGGSTLLEGTLTFEQSTGRSRFDLDDGTTLVFDGSTAWVSPQSSPMQGARFHVLTWPYFMAAPFKLDDEGVRIELHGLNTFNNNLYESAKLTFEPGVGDSPDDWYILFIDNRTPRLAGMVYIVTYGQSLDEAEKEPHAIVYEDYRNINGVNLSTRWTFHDWDEVTGLKNPPLGSAQWSNLEFITPEQGTFDKPADAREDAQP